MKYYTKNPAVKQYTLSDNGSFLLWIPGRIWFKNLIFVGRDIPDKNDGVFRHFEKATVVDSCTDVYSRQCGIRLMYFQNASDSAWIAAQKTVREKKEQFGE